MSQKRQTKSKAYILQALTQLLQEKNWDKISVSQICQKAGINRGTFYLHYTDKYDLMEKIQEEKSALLLAILQKEKASNQELLESMLEAVKADGDFLKVYIQHPELDFHSSFRLIVDRILDAIPQLEEQLKNRFQLPTPYAKPVFVASVQEMIAIWILSDFPQSSQDLASMILELGQLQELHQA